MKYPLYILSIFMSIHISFSQETPQDIEVDSLYKEDQFYVGMTYNLLINMPSGVAQSGFSSGFHLGFTKDMPINTNRNIAIGLGIGYSANSFNQNVLVNKDNSGNFTYTILDDGVVSYSKNKFSTHLIEVPIQFRWRTSTANDYKFWRIYTGFKLGYVIAHTTKFNGELGDFKFNDNSHFNDFQYGLTFSLGYNTWNAYFYYALNPIFSSDAKLNDNSIDMKAVRIGLIFYIL